MANRAETGAEMTLEQLEDFESELPPGDIYSIEAQALATGSGFGYDYTFVAGHPLGQFIRISGERPVVFLQQGVSLARSVGDLTGIAQKTRLASGGQFIIHLNGTPVLGLAGDTPEELNPSKLMHFDAPLSVALELRGSDQPEPATADGILDKVKSVGGVALATMNWMNMDSLVLPEQLEAWRRAFNKYNPVKIFGGQPVPDPIEISPKTVADLLRELQSNGTVEQVKLTSLNLIR